MTTRLLLYSAGLYNLRKAKTYDSMPRIGLWTKKINSCGPVPLQGLPVNLIVWCQGAAL